jgi:ribosomal-protein-alanine N-acetyltransferase
VRTRLITPDDAPALAALLTVNRAFMAPWEPIRDDSYYTADGQLAVIAGSLEQYNRGAALPHVIVEDGRIVGRINVNTIVRGPFQSGSLGYFVDESRNGRGVATAAVAEMARIAFGEQGLHRLEAGTLLDNIGSQRVLERNGFQRYGLAPRYLRIAGQWQDHVLFQLLNEE